jgi:hypothetical protein
MSRRARALLSIGFFAVAVIVFALVPSSDAAERTKGCMDVVALGSPSSFPDIGRFVFAGIPALLSVLFLASLFFVRDAQEIR